MHCAHVPNVPNVNHILHTTNTKPNCPYQGLPASFILLLKFFNRAPSSNTFRESLRLENSPTSVTLGKLNFVVSHPFCAQTTLKEVEFVHKCDLPFFFVFFRHNLNPSDWTVSNDRENTWILHDYDIAHLNNTRRKHKARYLYVHTTKNEIRIILMLVIARNATSDSDECILFSIESKRNAKSVDKTNDVQKTQENIQVEIQDKEIQKLRLKLDQMHTLVKRFREQAVYTRKRIMELQQTKT